MSNISFLNRTFPTIAAAALFVGLAVPAQATNSSTNNNRSDDAQAQAQAGASRQAGDRRICVRADFTGSRLLRTICKTEREWEAEGGIPTAD